MPRLRTALSALALSIATLAAPAAALAAPDSPASHAPASPALTPATPEVGPRTGQGEVPGTSSWEEARRSQPAVTAQGDVIHVDCTAPAGGDGSDGAPLSTLAAASEVSLSAGDQLVLRRGTTCEGTLTVTGQGTRSAPIVVGAYGPGTERAHIEGASAATAVHLQDMEHVILQDLEVTNSTDPGSVRRGVMVSLSDTGTRSGFELRNLDIHDVFGGDAKGPNGSQGLAFRITGTTPSSFDDVSIHDNSIRHVDRQGMVVVLSDFSCRPEIGCAGAENWTPSTDVVIERNLIEDTGGDGIVANTTLDAVLQDNVVRGFNVRSKQYNAGLWTYNTTGTLAQHNEASGGKGHLDGMAYDIDGGSVDNTFQYNYSHDNEGGFFLLCTHSNIQRGSLVQFNVSQNDQYRGIENCKGPIESALVRHNTIYIGDGIDQTVINEDVDVARGVRFEGNIVSKEGSGTAAMNLAEHSGYTFAGNVLHGVTGAPQNPGGTVEDPQLCSPGTATDARDAVRAYRLASGSPASGIAPSAGPRLKDYSGMPVHPRTPSAGALGIDRHC